MRIVLDSFMLTAGSRKFFYQGFLSIFLERFLSILESNFMQCGSRPVKRVIRGFKVSVVLWSKLC